jgi:hypothetical protein
VVRSIALICNKESVLKPVAEHGIPAFGLLFAGLVLDDIPMLHKDAVLQAENVGRDPVHPRAESGKPAMHDHEIPVGNMRPDSYLKVGGMPLMRLNSLTPGLYVCAVLNIVRRPITLCCRIVAFIEKRIEYFQDDRFVLFERVFWHRNLCSTLSLASVCQLAQNVHCVGSEFGMILVRSVLGELRITQHKFIGGLLEEYGKT